MSFSSAVFDMFSTCFLVFKSFHKQDICHCGIVVADGFAVIHKVAQCLIPMQIRYILIYFIHHIKTGPLHMFKLFNSWICIPHQPHKVTSGQITVTVSYEQKAGSLFYTEHNQ